MGWYRDGPGWTERVSRCWQRQYLKTQLPYRSGDLGYQNPITTQKWGVGSATIFHCTVQKRGFQQCRCTTKSFLSFSLTYTSTSPPPPPSSTSSSTSLSWHIGLFAQPQVGFLTHTSRTSLLRTRSMCLILKRLFLDMLSFLPSYGYHFQPG